MTTLLDDGTALPLKAWKNIEPTLIGSDFNRYEIVKWQSPTTFLAWVKMPCRGMDGCDRCPGPHRPLNRTCSQNWDRQPQIPQLGPNAPGIVLMELFTGKVWTGLWHVEPLPLLVASQSGLQSVKNRATVSRKSGLAVLSIY
jgi:hypothetical protein